MLNDIFHCSHSDVISLVKVFQNVLTLEFNPNLHLLEARKLFTYYKTWNNFRCPWQYHYLSDRESILYHHDLLYFLLLFYRLHRTINYFHKKAPSQIFDRVLMHLQLNKIALQKRNTPTQKFKIASTLILKQRTGVSFSISELFMQS